MIEPLDRSNRDSTLFQFTTKQPLIHNHPLIRIDERLDSACLVELSEGCHRPDFGRRVSIIR